jgi:hypothetical protein
MKHEPAVAFFLCLWSAIIKKMGRVSGPKSTEKVAEGPSLHRPFDDILTSNAGIRMTI